MSEKARTMTVFGSQGYHKGYVADKYQFTVLAIDRIPKEQKEMVRAKVKTLTSGREAEAIVGNGWTYEILDKLGRVGVLKFNGIEVALFLKRQVVTEQPAPGDPIPEEAIKDAYDQWQRLEVLGPSAKAANFFIKRNTEALSEQVGILNARVENLQQLADGFEIEAGHKQTAVEDLQKVIARLRLQLSPKDQIIVKKPGFKYLTEAQAKKVRAAAAKRARKP